jgi:ABC-type microcin C transport system permease subunit YejE
MIDEMPGPVVDDGTELETAALGRPVRARLNPLAVASLLLGLVLSPLAALFGHIAVGQINRSFGRERGLVIAWVAVGLGWLWMLALVIVASAVWLALNS